MQLLSLFFLAATPFYLKWWFLLLFLIGIIVAGFYGLRWYAGRRYRQIMESRRKADARIDELLREMKKRGR